MFQEEGRDKNIDISSSKIEMDHNDEFIEEELDEGFEELLDTSGKFHNIRKKIS